MFVVLLNLRSKCPIEISAQNLNLKLKFETGPNRPVNLRDRLFTISPKTSAWLPSPFLTDPHQIIDFDPAPMRRLRRHSQWNYVQKSSRWSPPRPSDRSSPFRGKIAWPPAPLDGEIVNGRSLTVSGTKFSNRGWRHRPWFFAKFFFRKHFNDRERKRVSDSFFTCFLDC